MTRPHLNHAVLGDRKWAWIGNCWWEWSSGRADWLPSHDPPPEAKFLNYRVHILKGENNG